MAGSLVFYAFPYGVVRCSCGFTMLLVDLNRRALADIRFSDKFLWSCMVLMFFNVFD